MLDEHFRRALGEKNYDSIFNSKKEKEHPSLNSKSPPPPISSSSKPLASNKLSPLPRVVSSPTSALHSGVLYEGPRTSRLDAQRLRSPANSLNSSTSSTSSSDISVTRITPKSSPDGKSEQKTSEDVDPVKAFQDDMGMEGYTGNGYVLNIVVQ